MFKELLQKLIKMSSETIVLLVWIVVVGLIFRFIADRQIAGLLAGTGFVIIPIWLMYKQLNLPNSYVKGIKLGVVAFFLLFNALPIIGLRLFNWGLDFNTLNLFGIVTGRQIHQVSSWIYLAMVLCYIFIGDNKDKNHKIN